MQGWQTTYLGMRELPRDISGFELQAFFTFSPAERALIDARRGDAHKLGLALHIGFLRMSGRLLDALRIVPPGPDRWMIPIEPDEELKEVQRGLVGVTGGLAYRGQ